MEETILVIGDVMLDRYVDGTCERISPEAPVPVLNAREESYILGGAANVALNLKKLGIPTAIIGPIGIDPYGLKLQELVSEAKIGNFLLSNHVQTTVKTRITAKSQQLLRVDRESIYVENEQMEKHITKYLANHNPNLVVVSDYGKGFITEGVMLILMHYCKSNSSCRVLIDPKGVEWEKYNGSFLIKPNIKEISEIVGRELSNSDIDIELMDYIYQSFDIKHLLLTQSSNGMSLYNKEGLKVFPTQKVEVFDVTGAGDTAIAVIAYGLYNDFNLDKSIQLANQASSFVVTKNKTYAISKEELDLLT